MSGLALVADLEGRPVPPDALSPLLECQSHRGPDGRRAVDLGFAALGHLRFWTTPEEVGEQQPLEDGGLWLLFEGRIDNRDELVAELGLGAGDSRSDCGLAFAAYRRFGDAAFERILGPFAAVLVDVAARTVLLARDSLGERTLFYVVLGSRLFAASEDGALLGVPGLAEELDEGTAIRYLAAEPPAEGATFFRDVRELPPGHLLRARCGETEVRLERYWEPQRILPTGALDSLSSEEWAERFRDELDRAVAARLRAVGSPAIQMSGGLDSGSVAALAARRLGGDPPSGRLRVYTWTFDELRECDERGYVAAMVARWSLLLQPVPSDGLWPLHEEAPYLATPGRPVANAYRLLKQRLYERAAGDGVKVLLNGACGDLLYVGGMRGWLRSALRRGLYGRALRETLRYAVRGPWRALVQGAAGCLRLDAPLRRRSPRDRWPWLTERALEVLAGTGGDVELPRRLEALAGRRASGVGVEDFFTSRAGIELRDPYRDRRLVELALAVPEDLLFRGGVFKYLLRNALGSLLPAEVRERRELSTLLPLFRRGFVEREGDRARRLAAADARWQEWVRVDWVEHAWKRLDAGSLGSVEMVVLWSVVSFAMWCRAGAQGTWRGRS